MPAPCQLALSSKVNRVANLQPHVSWFGRCVGICGRGWLEWRVQSYVVPSLIYSTNSVTVGASLVYDEAHWLAVPLISSLGAMLCH